MSKTTRFDAADYLDTEERQVAYITAALETGDADFVRDALVHRFHETNHMRRIQFC
jgi:DNA-binding phage protein